MMERPTCCYIIGCVGCLCFVMTKNQCFITSIPTNRLFKPVRLVTLKLSAWLYFTIIMYYNDLTGTDKETSLV